MELRGEDALIHKAIRAQTMTVGTLNNSTSSTSNTRLNRITTVEAKPRLTCISQASSIRSSGTRPE